MPSKKTKAPSFLANLVRFNDEVNRFDTLHLPAEAWKGLCVVAWMRLEQVNPRWSRHIANEFTSFLWTLTSNSFKDRYSGGNACEKWMVDAFRSMHQTKLKQGPKPHALDPRLLWHYHRKIVRDITKIKKEHHAINKKPEREQTAFWQEKIQGIINHLPSPTNAVVTQAMIEKARFESPSDVGYEILHHLYGTGRYSLKTKVFPRLRKTPLSPLELYQPGLLNSSF